MQGYLGGSTSAKYVALDEEKEESQGYVKGSSAREIGICSRDALEAADRPNKEGGQAREVVVVGEEACPSASELQEEPVFVEDTAKSDQSFKDLPPGSFGDVHWGVRAREEAEGEEKDPAMQEQEDAFLEEIRTADDARCLELVQNSPSHVINAMDGMDNIRALCILAAEGRLEACKFLVERDDFQGVNAIDVIGSNALHLAAGNDNVEVCQYLLECPRFLAGVNAQNFHMRTPLDFAVDFGDGDAANILKAAGGIKGSGGGREARKSGRYNLGSQGVLERLPSDDEEQEEQLPTLDELEGEPVPDMAELD